MTQWSSCCVDTIRIGFAVLDSFSLFLGPFSPDVARRTPTGMREVGIGRDPAMHAGRRLRSLANVTSLLCLCLFWQRASSMCEMTDRRLPESPCVSWRLLRMCTVPWFGFLVHEHLLVSRSGGLGWHFSTLLNPRKCCMHNIQTRAVRKQHLPSSCKMASAAVVWLR